MFRSTNHRTGGFMRPCASSLDAYVNDQFWDNVAFLIPSRAPNASTDIIDIKGNAITVGGGAQISTAVRCAGDAPTILFDGSSDYFTLPDVAPSSSVLGTRIGLQDFTLEFFRYFNTSFTTFQTLMSKGYSGAGGFLIQTQATSNGRLQVYHNTTLLLNEASGPAIGDLDHYAIDRFFDVTTGNYSMKLYKNGTSIATATTANAAINFSNSTQEWRFGGGSSTGINDFWLKGGLGMIRLTLGVARYRTGNFTAPVSPFPIYERQE